MPVIVYVYHHRYRASSNIFLRPAPSLILRLLSHHRRQPYTRVNPLSLAQQRSLALDTSFPELLLGSVFHLVFSIPDTFQLPLHILIRPPIMMIDAIPNENIFPLERTQETAHFATAESKTLSFSGIKASSLRQMNTPMFPEFNPAALHGGIRILDGFHQLPTSDPDEPFMVINETEADGIIGSQSLIRCHTATVSLCSSHVTRKLAAAHKLGGVSSQSPGGPQVELKVFSWDYQTRCECFRCTLFERHKEWYHIMRLSPLQDPLHKPYNLVTRSFVREVAALKRSSRIYGSQQIIAYEVFPSQRNAKLV